jgi:hypothetical protein
MTATDVNDACWYEDLIDEGRHADLTPDVAAGEERKLSLAFSTVAGPLRIGGKWVSVRSVPSGLPPMFVLKDVRLPFDVSQYDKLSVPADPATPFGSYVARLDGLLRKAAKTHAANWFGIKDLTEAAFESVELKTGLFTTKTGARMLSCKFVEDPKLVDANTGAKRALVMPSEGGTTRLAGHVADIVLSIDGCFVRGLQLFLRWRVHAVRDHGAGTGTGAVSAALDAFSIVDE